MHFRALALALGFVSPVVAESPEASDAAPDDETSLGDVAVEMPRPLQVEVTYPNGAQGDAQVVLELTLDAQGKVTETHLQSGDPPFAEVALLASPHWLFTPAKRDGVPTAARINYRVVFRQPRPQGKKEDSAIAPPAVAPMPTSEPIEVAVQGVRKSPGARVINDELTRLVPGAEGDPLRVVEAMPGTIPLISGGPFVAVRGALPGKVGYVYDSIRIPYLFHLARGASVLHPWLVSSATLYGGAAPARFGRASGGVIVANPGGAPLETKAYGLARLTDSAVGAATPFATGDGFVVFAGRYSYTRPMVSLVAPDYSLDFWDYQGRLGYRVNSTDSVFVSAFGAGDTSVQRLADGRNDYLFNGSFHRVNLEYQSEGPASTQSVALTLGHDAWENPDSATKPRTRSLEVRARHEWLSAPARSFAVGAGLGVERVRDGVDVSPANHQPQISLFERDDTIGNLWGEYSQSYPSGVVLNPSLRIEVYHSEETPKERASTWFSPEPRFAMTVPVSEAVLLHQTVGVAAQAPSSAQRAVGRTLSVEGGLERTVNNEIGAEFALSSQVSLGVALFHKVFFATKDIEHLQGIQGQKPQSDAEWRRARGTGLAYGAELMVEGKLSERLQGFIAYTPSRSERSFGRAQGPAEFERRHVLDVALGYDFGAGWYAATRSTYYTGFIASGLAVTDLASGPRTRPHYQIDWRLEKRWKVGTAGSYLGIVAEVLNTTLNREALDLDCSVSPCREQRIGPVSVPTLGLEGSY